MKLRTHGLSSFAQKQFIVWYIVTGIVQPLLLDQIELDGAASSWSFIYSLPNAIGMALILLLPLTQASKFTTTIKQDLKEFMWPMVLLSLLDVTASTVVLFGQLAVGSAMYTIIYSSVSIWTAIGSFFLLGRKLDYTQWICIAVVTVGLCFSGLDALNQPGNDMIIGSIITLVGTILHAGTYFCAEALLRRPDQRDLHPQRLCGLVGIFDIVWLSLYVLIYTVPRWQELVVDPIVDAGSRWTEIAILYVLLTLVDALHAGFFYNMIGVVGSVSMAVFKTVASVGVFIGSALIFCGVDQSECMNVYKVVSLFTVCGGVVGYSVFTARRADSDGKIGVVVADTQEEAGLLSGDNL
eukprot:gnl/Dysnectes_brevis/4425_a5944_1005.p1 GENE.gnl/Dysnectes_brevis/4425_a5944_1005~~gnl/Dysnectes_brevis/4425_a5944_1005.p1  ORF type:complete len:353 (-),score=91.05 gnl/Dysnectes_brevis/4425_a5944_1005:37-1095(-)